MTLQDLSEFVVNNGIACVVVFYFLWKDSKLTKENTEILNEVKALLDVLVKEKK